jgi:hypothetical protein
MALTDNIVAYYKLDESSGNATDSVGGFTLTNNNTVAYSTGKINNGADGGSANTNKYLSVANDLGVAGGNCSISFWVKNNTEVGAGGDYSFVHQGDLGTFVNNTVWYEYNGGTRRLNFYRQRQNVGGSSAYYTVTLGTSNFTHIVYTYDGTDIRGYVDGSLVAGPTAASGSGSAGAIDIFQIMSFYAYGTYTERIASSIVDEVGIWTRAISNSEVTSLYNAGNGLQYPFTATSNNLTLLGVS